MLIHQAGVPKALEMNVCSLEIPNWVINTLSPVNRWVHMVSSTLLVGGVLFFEFVAPLATAGFAQRLERMAVFGRVARWVFRKESQSLSMVLLTHQRRNHGVAIVAALPPGRANFYGGVLYEARPWVAGAILCSAVLGFIIVPAGDEHGARGIRGRWRWLRARSLVILLVCIFFASVSRHLRLRVSKR